MSGEPLGIEPKALLAVDACAVVKTSVLKSFCLGQTFDRVDDATITSPL